MLNVMFNVFLKPKAQKQFDALSVKDRGRVFNASEGLRDDPFAGKKLQGELYGFYSLRVWPYRIIYTIEKRIITVTVVAIGQRKEIYRLR